MTGGARYFPVAIPSFIDNNDHTLPLHSNNYTQTRRYCINEPSMYCINCTEFQWRMQTYALCVPSATREEEKYIMNAYLLKWEYRQLMPSVDDADTELETAK